MSHDRLRQKYWIDDIQVNVRLPKSNMQNICLVKDWGGNRRAPDRLHRLLPASVDVSRAKEWGTCDDHRGGRALRNLKEPSHESCPSTGHGRICRDDSWSGWWVAPRQSRSIDRTRRNRTSHRAGHGPRSVFWTGQRSLRDSAMLRPAESAGEGAARFSRCAWRLLLRRPGKTTEFIASLACHRAN